jgi:hypothetical protein
MLTCDIVRTCDVVYDMNLGYRMSCTYDILYLFPTLCGDIRHCIRYVEMKTYDVVCDTYDVVCRRTTSYVTYDVARTRSYVYILYTSLSIARTTSYVRCSTRCCMSHVRCRTCMTYDIVLDVRHRRWQESRWYLNLKSHSGWQFQVRTTVCHSVAVCYYM